MEEKVCTRAEADDMAKHRYGEFFHTLFVGDPDTKGQTSYGRTTTTMNVVTETSPETHGHDALRDYLLDFYGYLRQKKQWTSEDSSSSAPPVPPPLPERPQPFDEEQIRKYVMSNMISTDGLQLHAVAYDLRKPHRSSKARVGIQDLSKAFPDRGAIEEVFGEQPKTVVVGCDPGEIVTAAFCAVDPQNPEQVQNLSVKRAALYAPVFAYRDELARRKEEAGIYEIEETISARTYQSSKELEERLAGTLESVETLRIFYGSNNMKKLNWERSKARRAELDWAACGALSMVKDKDQALFVIGNARFNTHQSLATLHESFKGHFYQQATSQGYHVVSTDEFCTSSPTCAERGGDIRVAKPTVRSCVCLEEECDRWINRDSLGAHNLALIGRAWLERLQRPDAFCGSILNSAAKLQLHLSL
ncbi:hypothetical protein BGX34_006638, partial [Mortierella sp. NVP85]